jgi:hypothetical protein
VNIFKRKARRLTKLKIDEVSAVDKSAGVGTKIMLKKRASDAAFEATRCLAMSVKSILADPDCDMDAMLTKTFSQYQQHLDGLMRRYPKNANLDVSVPEADPEDGMPARRRRRSDDDADYTERLSDDADADDEDDEPTDNDGADPDGAPTKHLERLRDAMKGTDMDPLKKLKSLDAVRICKQMVIEEHAFGLSEHDLVSLVDNYAKAHGTTFADLYTKQDDVGLACRKAVDIAKNAQFVSRMSTVSKAQPQFSADRSSEHFLAHGAVDGPAGRPGRATLRPRVVGGADARAVDSPRRALDQLNELAAEQRRQNKTLSEAGAFAAVYLDPRNAELVRREREENRPVAV